MFTAKTHLQGRWLAMVRHMQGCNEQFVKTHFGKEQNILHLKLTLRTVTFVNTGQGNFSWAAAFGPTALHMRVSLNVPGKLHKISKEIIPPWAVCYRKKAICLFWISCTEGPLLSQESVWSELQHKSNPNSSAHHGGDLTASKGCTEFSHLFEHTHTQHLPKVRRGDTLTALSTSLLQHSASET